MTGMLSTRCVVVVLLLVLTACAGMPTSGESTALPGTSATTSIPVGERDIPVLTEALVSRMTPEDNIDSLATWVTPDDTLWVIATAKSTDTLVVYDGHTGTTLHSIGERGTGPGQFRRPNGVAVIDDLLFVVERDNHRVQVLRLPDFSHLASFADDDLIKPYGLWLNRVGPGYQLYVTDSYMAGEDEHGEDILPPLDELTRRVKRYSVWRVGNDLHVRLLNRFGDSSADGALRVVESIWGDPSHGRLLIAEEDESYANELKVYDLIGNYLGRTIGRDVFQAQSEGIALKTCADGSGWWLTTEQGKGRTVFHLFDRRSLEHVGAVTGTMVANTDGIWLHEAGTDRFPEGVLYAVHDDQGIAAFDWRDIAQALNLPACTRN